MGWPSRSGRDRPATGTGTARRHRRLRLPAGPARHGRVVLVIVICPPIVIAMSASCGGIAAGWTSRAVRARRQQNTIGVTRRLGERAAIGIVRVVGALTVLRPHTDRHAGDCCRGDRGDPMVPERARGPHARGCVRRTCAVAVCPVDACAALACAAAVCAALLACGARGGRRWRVGPGSVIAHRTGPSRRAGRSVGACERLRGSAPRCPVPRVNGVVRERPVPTSSRGRRRSRRWTAPCAAPDRARRTGSGLEAGRGIPHEL